MKYLILLFFATLMVSPLFSLEEQSYQARVLIDESRKEDLIFPLPKVNFNDLEEYLNRVGSEKKVISESDLTESIIDLCGLIPLKEDV